MKITSFRLLWLVSAAASVLAASANPSPSPYVYRPGWIRTYTRFLNSQSTNVTMEIWVRPMSSTTSPHHLIEQYSAGGLGRQNFTLERVDDTNLRVRNWLGGSGNIAAQEMVSNVSGAGINGGLVKKGDWSHIAWVCEGDVWRLYINGELNNEESGHDVANHLDQSGSDGFVIGNSRTSNPNGCADAYFAEARLWKRARTGAEIKAWYDKRIPEAWKEPDLIGYWPMVEGKDVVEANGGFRNYVISSAVNNPNNAPFLCNYADYSDAVNVSFPEKHVSVPVTGELIDVDHWAFRGHYSSAQRSLIDTRIYDNPHNFTMMGWFLRSENGSGDPGNCYFGKSIGGNGRFLVREWSGVLRAWMGGGSYGKTNEEVTVALPPDADLSRWHHVAVVKRNQEMRIYINGRLEKVGGPFTMDLLNTQTLQIGGFEAGGSRGPFRGLVKDVSFWSKALSEEKIVTYMTWSPRGNESGLLGYWPLNDTNDTTVANLKVGAPNGVRFVPTGDSAKNFWTGTNLFWTKSVAMPLMNGPAALRGSTLLVK